MTALTRDDILKLDETDGETALRRYCDALDRGERPDADTENFLKAAFLAIRNGIAPKKALKLGHARGRKSPDSLIELSRKTDAAASVLRLMRHKMSYEKAVERTAEEMKLSYRTVQRHYAAARELAESGMTMDEVISKLLRQLDVAVAIARERTARRKTAKRSAPLDNK
jgi:hypothetical protein